MWWQKGFFSELDSSEHLNSALALSTVKYSLLSIFFCFVRDHCKPTDLHTYKNNILYSIYSELNDIAIA